jgi:hypothetical protein
MMILISVLFSHPIRLKKLIKHIENRSALKSTVTAKKMSLFLSGSSTKKRFENSSIAD